jgi:hypothetical protein
LVGSGGAPSGTAIFVENTFILVLLSARPIAEMIPSEHVPVCDVLRVTRREIALSEMTAAQQHRRQQIRRAAAEPDDGVVADPYLTDSEQ